MASDPITPRRDDATLDRGSQQPSDTANKSTINSNGYQSHRGNIGEECALGSWETALVEADKALARLQRGDPEAATDCIARGWRRLLGEERVETGVGSSESVDGEPSAEVEVAPTRPCHELRQLERAIRLRRRQEWAEQHPRLGRITTRLKWATAAAAVVLVAGAARLAQTIAPAGTAAQGTPQTVNLRAQTLRGFSLPAPLTPRSGITFAKRAEVRFSETVRPGRITVSLSNDDLYWVKWVRKTEVVHACYLGPRHLPRGLHSYRFYMPQDGVQRGFDTIIVEGLEGESGYRIGPIILEYGPPPRP